METFRKDCQERNDFSSQTSKQWFLGITKQMGSESSIVCYIYSLFMDNLAVLYLLQFMCVCAKTWWFLVVVFLSFSHKLSNNFSCPSCCCNRKHPTVFSYQHNRILSLGICWILGVLGPTYLAGASRQIFSKIKYFSDHKYCPVFHYFIF